MNYVIVSFCFITCLFNPVLKAQSNSKVFNNQDSITIPKAFTPNNDGVNDSWTPLIHIAYDSIQANIYNRWGELVFSSTSSEVNWNGKNKKGKFVETGMYLFNLKVFLHQKVIEKKGNIMVFY